MAVKERKLAYESLVKIMIEGKYSNLVLRFNRENTPFVTQLVYGTLRNYRLLRYSWSQKVSRQPAGKLAVLLDMAAYELLMMDSPDYAVIDEAVDIAHDFGKSQAGFVNGVLRKLSPEDLKTADPAIRTSHPDWLWALWKAHYGEEVGMRIMEADLDEPKVGLRINRKLMNAEQLSRMKGFTPATVAGAFYYDGNILETEVYRRNQVIIQSESSQEVVRAMDIQPGMRVLDLCAAPGSKSLQIAEQLNGKGEVVANELYESRTQLIRENAIRYGYENIRTISADGREIAMRLEPGSFDAVLLDAPCSGLGTLKHKPEIKIRITPEDLDDIIALQKELLDEAALMVRKGGELMYSTCTLNRKENDRQVESFLKDHPDFRLKLNKTVYPFDYQSDGFFYGLMVRE